MTTQDINQLSADKKRQLLEQLLRDRLTAERIDLEREAHIQLRISDAPRPDPGLVESPMAVLLTGVTGFVGAFLLHALCLRTSARMFCLVRAQDEKQGLERIRENLAKYGLWSDGIGSRLVVVPADLSKPRMGLSAERHHALASEIDVIYHIAATVNLAYKYERLKPTNVNGTREILELASSGRVKPVHYLSSYAPFDSTHNAGKTIYERDVPQYSEGLSTGYNETKWVAERMVHAAREQGLPAAIYRVGWVAGHTATGVWNSSDFIPRLIQACTALGKYTFLGVVTMTPVDYLVESLLCLSRKQASLGDTFHLSNGERYSTRLIFEWVRAYGYRVEEVSYPEWEAAMQSSSQEAALMPMKLFLESAPRGMKLSDWFAREPIIDSSYTRSALSRWSVSAPSLDQSLMSTYLDHFIASGHLNPPE